MADKLVELSCVEFSEALAGKQSVPGGGGAAAIAGALGAALCEMVGNFTTGKKTYAAVEDDIQRMLAEVDEVRVNLIALVDADARAFEPLSRAYGIPKDDPDRAEVLEAATKGACAAPLQMMRETARAVVLLEEMEQKGSRMLVSDAGCGGALCAAALQCAAMNVYINTKSLADRAYAAELDGEVDGLLAEYVPRANAIAARVTERVKA